jgi:hypothetical protein
MHNHRGKVNHQTPDENIIDTSTEHTNETEVDNIEKHNVKRRETFRNTRKRSRRYSRRYIKTS